MIFNGNPSTFPPVSQQVKLQRARSAIDNELFTYTVYLSIAGTIVPLFFGLFRDWSYVKKFGETTYLNVKVLLSFSILFIIFYLSIKNIELKQSSRNLISLENSLEQIIEKWEAKENLFVFHKTKELLVDFPENKLLSYSVDSGASDLHLSVGSIPMVRINGTMQPLNMGPLKQEDIESILPQILDEDQIQSFEKNKEIDFSASLEGKGRFRVNFFNQIKGMAGVFRTIPEVVKDFDDLGIPPVLRSLALLNRGLVLLTGPTGSGKSTTLAAMVDHINTQRKCHIITIEDPVEYYHETKESLINQRELGANTHSFANAMRSALREDPDVILVGEMRDLETISLALTAAETGHLVLSTLHTSSAVKTIDRIIDIFPTGQKGQIRSMLSESLEAVIAQKLLKTKDGKGRSPACEVMIANTAIRNLIREDRIYQIPSIIQSGGVDGMQSLDQDLQRLVSKGEIERKMAQSIADNPKLFAQNVL